jgi:hypothetical protein
MTATFTQLSLAFPDAVVISWFILFIILLSQNVMHSVLSQLLNLSHTTTWTGFMNLYNTWLAEDLGRAMDHTAYIPDLTPIDYHILGPLQKHLLGSDLQQFLCETSCHLAKGI